MEEDKKGMKEDVEDWYTRFLLLERRYGSTNIPAPLRSYMLQAERIIGMKQTDLGIDANAIVVREITEVPPGFLTDVDIGRDRLALSIRFDYIPGMRSLFT